MDPPRLVNAGFTLLEALVAIAIVGVLAAIAAPSARRATDLAAVRAARDATATLLSRARSEATARGGAHLSIDLASSRLVVRSGRPGAGGDAIASFDLRERFGVRVESGGVSTGTVSLTYDAYGIGRVASRSLRFRRGPADAGLTVSSYGRVLRW